MPAPARSRAFPRSLSGIPHKDALLFIVSCRREAAFSRMRQGAMSSTALSRRVRHQISFSNRCSAPRRFRHVSSLPVSPICKDVRFDALQLGTYAHVARIFLVGRQHDPIHASDRLDQLFPLPLRHKDAPFFLDKPMVVVHDDDERIAEFFRGAEHADMPDMDGVKPAGDRDDDRLLYLFLSHMYYFVFPSSRLCCFAYVPSSSRLFRFASHRRVVTRPDEK